jgi:hypothetical protein
MSMSLENFIKKRETILENYSKTADLICCRASELIFRSLPVLLFLAKMMLIFENV